MVGYVQYIGNKAIKQLNFRKYNQFIFSSAFIGVCAFISRFLGYVRDVLILNWVGIGYITDAYVLSTKLPSLFRKVISDGSMNNILIPLLKDIKLKKLDERDFIKQLIWKFFKYMLIIILICVLMINFIAKLIFPNLSPEATKYLIYFSRFVFPSLFFISLSSIWMSFLNYSKRFFSVAMASIVCNVSAIIMLFLAYKFDLSYLFIGAAILFGNIMQYIWIVWNVKINKLDKKYENIQFNEMQDFKDRMVNISFSSGVTQIMILFSSWAVSFLPTGNISYLAFSDRIMQVPISLIGLIMSTTFLVYISQYIKDKKSSEAFDLYKNALKITTLFSVLLTIFIFLYSFLICKILFLRGKTSLIDVYNISFYLKIYVLSIPAYSISKVVNAVFYAHGDTVTPMRSAILQCIVNIILVFSLFSFKALGISLAFVISSWVYSLYVFLVLILKIRQKKFFV